MTDTDVVVVGGGATGVGVARDLAMRGLDVVCCERGGLGAGTTGRSHGLLHSGARYATDDPDGATHCIQENRILRRTAGVAVQETGGLFVRVAGDDAGHYDARVRACREVGIPVEEIGAEEACDREPALTREVEGAFGVPDGVVYPSRLVAATAEDARQHGAEIRTGTPVRDVLVDGDRVVGVAIPSGPIGADHVVNAAGAWAGRVAALAGVDVPMAPTKGVMVAVELGGVARVLNRCRPPDDGDIAVPHDGRVVLGTTSTAIEDPDDYARETAAVDRVIEAGAALLPGVADADVADVYWGVRPLYDAGPGGREATRTFQVFDHTADGRPGLTTVTGGKLTTYRLMAEAVSDAVCERLGVDRACRTAEEPLPADDPTAVDGLVETYCGTNPADADVIGR